jgi:hypothetical protein
MSKIDPATLGCLAERKLLDRNKPREGKAVHTRRGREVNLVEPIPIREEADTNG